MTTAELIRPQAERKPRRRWEWLWTAGFLMVGLPLALVAALLEGGIGYPEE